VVTAAGGPGTRAAASTAELDAMAPEDAAARLAPLFEGAPRFLARLVGARPFGTWDRLFDRARAIAHEMPEPEQVELIDAHPRLGAATASVSAASFREQGYEHSTAPDGIAKRLAELNAAYEARFGFRYCVFVAGRPLAALIPELEAALARPIDEHAAERHRALDAVIVIARARHEAGVGAGSGVVAGGRTGAASGRR
jgi:2-oxo-4-hydroxy-4-carboxy--5-ureidoimidazoline (OHCU) decarboxylase